MNHYFPITLIQIFCLTYAKSLIRFLRYVSHSMKETYKVALAPNEASDQLGYPPSLICLRCPHEETMDPSLPIERAAKILVRLSVCWWLSCCDALVMKTLLFLNSWIFQLFCRPLFCQRKCIRYFLLSAGPARTVRYALRMAFRRSRVRSSIRRISFVDIRSWNSYLRLFSAYRCIK